MTESLNEHESTLIPRAATGKRILFAILFIVLVRVVEAVLAIIILFEIAYALITRRARTSTTLPFERKPALSYLCALC